MRRSLSSVILSYFPVFSFFISVFFLFLLSPVDTDLGWQLRYGDYFLEHGRPLMENTLSVLMEGYRWPNSYTLYQPLAAFFYKHFSFWGLSLLNAFVFVLSFLFIFFYFRENLLKTLAVFMFVVLGGWSILGYGLRGQMMSFLFLSALLFVLHRIERRWPKALALFILFTLWGNFHGGFFLGVTLTLFWSFFQVVLPLWDGRRVRDVDWSTPLLCFFAAVLPPLINPYGLGNYVYVFQHLKAPMEQMIAEWVSPRTSLKIFISGLFASYLYLVFFRLRWRKHIFFVSATAAVFYLAFTARRNLPFFFLFQSVSFLELIPEKNFLGKIGDSRLRFFLVFPISVFLSYALLIQLPKTVRLNTDWEEYCEEGIVKYPCQAVEFIRENNLRGNVFNFYRWGGFLIWQFPENKVFVDGRMPAWPHPSGKSPYTIHLEIIQAQPGYQETLNHYGISSLIIPPGTFLDLELRGKDTSEWEEVYRDKVAVIYLRRKASKDDDFLSPVY